METIATSHGLARVEGSELAVLDLPYADVGELLCDTGSLSLVDSATVTRRLPLSRVSEVVRPPLAARRTTVWGVGLNYRAKAALRGRAVPDFPILFIKPPSSLAGPVDPISVPAGLSAEVDYEAELGIVIGRPMHGVSAATAWDHVAGIVTANDFTCRDVMAQTKTPLLAKGLPAFAPLGPSVLPIDEVADRDDVPVRSWVNGEQRQDGRTSDLIFPVAELLSIISRYGRLEPGDVVLTGTPPGTGQDLGKFLLPGDEIRVAVGDLVPLVSVVAASVPSTTSAPA